MFDVDYGQILLDKIDVRDIKLDNLHKQISYVPQDGFLFSDTIENNISFGAPTRDPEKIKEAAKMAVVSNDIENFPKEYQTEIGERGVSLSGGQKQRISIARALLKVAPILIMDDCLSAVDSRTEKEIVENLNSSMAGRTSILITHRIFNLVNFDRIVVMEEGELKEQGRHDELMNRKGIYYQLYLQQLQEDVNT
jgi:ATP-binding cassette subfamily B protein